jgi:N-methylhydantoinase A
MSNPSGTQVRVGTDVGGTFTDFALHDERTNRIEVAKVLTTAPDPAEGVLRGFDILLKRAGIDAAQVTYLAHASTVASNLVIERKGPAIAVITTQGFRDVILIQRQKRPNLYDHFYDKPQPIVRRRDIHEVRERMRADGSVELPLDERNTLDVLRDISERGFKSVAVVLLHSYANPAHELRIRQLAEGLGYSYAITLSSDISPRWREYERSSTAAMNAYVQPVVVRYLDSMQARLREFGMTRPIHVMQCSGGLVLAEGMKRAPVTMIESGPAAGALMAGFVGRVSGHPRVIAFDMGGTTAKVSIVEDGEPRLVEDFEIARVTKMTPGSGLPVSVPAVDLIEIGTGGGSIAHLDIGVLGVGPQSAGASPGPACYGFGGTEPTVTDANLVLGYLDPNYFLGGELKLDTRAARQAVNRAAQPLGVPLEAAAYAIHALANASMASAVRIVTVQRGFDPRDYIAVAFGGAGPLHIASIATEVGIPKALVPANAGIASAVGLLMARVKFEFVRTLKRRLEEAVLKELTQVFAELERRGLESLEESRARVGSALIRHARMRYVGQGFEITVEIPSGELDVSALDAIRQSFIASYRRLYGYADTGGDLEIVDFRVTALGPAVEGYSPSRLGAVNEEPIRSRRSAYFQDLGGFVDVDVWNRYELPIGFSLQGPAIVQERESTLLVTPGARAVVDDFNNLVLTLPVKARTAESDD